MAVSAVLAGVTVGMTGTAVAEQLGGASMTSGGGHVKVPIANADDPPPCDQQPPDQQQDCKQQKKGPGLPDLPNNNSGNSEQKPDNPNNIDLADKSCVMVDGVPTIIPPGGLGLPGSHNVGLPCFYVFHLTPH